MNRHRLSSFVAVLAVTAVATAGLAAPAGAGEASIVLYSGRSQELIEPIVEQFSADTGIEVEVRYGNSADLALLIDTEGEVSPADVFLSQSPGATGYLDAQGRLRKLPRTVTSKVEPRFRAHDERWVGITGRVRVLAYNTDLVDKADLPDSVLDLTAERFRGQVGIAPTNGSFQDFVTAMRELEGERRTERWLEGMAANDPLTFPDNNSIVQAVARGEIRYGIVNHYYAEIALADDPTLPVANHFFEDRDPGLALLVTAAGVLDSAPEPKLAVRLVRYLLSRSAQDIFAADEFEYPLAKGTKPATDLPPLDSIRSPRLDLSSLGGGLERTRELITESGLEQA